MSKKYVTEVLIGSLAIISIILLAVESLFSVSQEMLIGIYIADLIICIIFAWDFIRRLKSSEGRSQFLKVNGYEMVAMIPAIALYSLETIPAVAIALRSLRLLRVIRVILMAARVVRMLSMTGTFIHKSNFFTLFGITVSIIFIGAFAALILDSGTENARITSFSDAVWWSISTVTTVGYGDVVPSSMAGRIMGMILMIVGISIMTAFISQMSATLVELRLNRNSRNDDFKSSLISEIKSRIDNIDKLSESEVSLLIQTIQTLKETRGKGQGL